MPAMAEAVLLHAATDLVDDIVREADDMVGCVAYDPSGADLKGSIRYSGRSVRSPLIDDDLKDDH